MSTLDQNSIRKPLLGNLVLLAIATALGAILGAFIFGLVIGRSEAVGIIEIGKIGYKEDGNTGKYFPVNLESSKTMVDRLGAGDFLSIATKRLGDPVAAHSLLATQYGGGGDLQASAVRDEPLIQIRVRGDSKEQAIARAKAIMEEIVAQHEAMFASMRTQVNIRRERYQSQIAALRRREAQLVDQIENASKRAPDSVLYVFLLAEKNQIINQELDVVKELSRLEETTMNPFYQPTRTIMGPILRGTLLSSPLHTGLLGALAGLALGFALIQMHKMIT